LELAWGRWRRWYLKRFRSGYVRRMALKRKGTADGASHEILDPRDIKYCRNQCTCYWKPEDDPFRWRESLPFARWGLAELLIIGGTLLLATAACLWLFWYIAAIPLVLFILTVWFFRDPPRRVPAEEGLMVSPADGKVVEVTHLAHDEFVGGPAVRIGIFLSIFNVHINRMPCDCRVLEQRYHPGKFLNALDPKSAVENENLWVGIEETAPPFRKMIVRPIAGAIARRIVCGLRPGETLRRGEKFGMIKLGSRTELILPETEDLVIETRIGRKVKAGVSILARYK